MQHDGFRVDGSEVGMGGPGRVYRWVTPSERVEVVARVRAGATLREVGAVFGVSHVTVWRIVNAAALVGRGGGHSPRGGVGGGGGGYFWGVGGGGGGGGKRGGGGGLRAPVGAGRRGGG